MDLKETLFNNPMQIAEAFLIWFPMAICIVSLIGWMIMGDIEFVPGFLGIVAALVVGLVAMKPSRPEETPILLVGSVVTMVLFPVFRQAAIKREMQAIDVDTIARAYDQLEEMPNNAAAKFRIAKLAYQRGVHGHAVAVAESALVNLPAKLFAEEHKMVDHWKRATPREAYRSLPCVECGTLNPPGELYCRQCNARFLLDQARGSWIGKSTAKRFIVVWAAMMFALVAIPAATVLQPGLAIAAIAMTLIGVGLALWLALRESPQQGAA